VLILNDDAGEKNLEDELHDRHAVVNNHTELEPSGVSLL
jgi:hypothetical protein